MTIDEALHLIATRRYIALEKANYYKTLVRDLDGYTEIDNEIFQCTSQLIKGNTDIVSRRSALIEKRDQILAASDLRYDMLSPAYVCDKCQDTGFLKDGKKCQCLINLLNESDNTLRFNPDMTFDSFMPEKQDLSAYNKCIAYAKGSIKNNLLIMGRTGSGKTHMLNAIANYLHQKGKSVLYFTAFSLNREFVKMNTNMSITEQQRIWDTLLNTEYLLIDDLGTEQSYNNITLPCFYNLYNERNFGKHTATATNLNLDGLLHLYTDRIYSRLINKDITDLAHFKADDYRIPKKK